MGCEGFVCVCVWGGRGAGTEGLGGTRNREYLVTCLRFFFRFWVPRRFWEGKVDGLDWVDGLDCMDG